ncbi:MAG: DMT family transporter, partial [Eubacteriales bacterium]|nr:DMT family transporter [Eubacteriales bacterium]
MAGYDVMQGKTQARGVILLLITAFIWGTAFVSQSVGMEKVEAFTFNGIRTLMGGVALLVFILVRDRINEKAMGSWQLERRKKTDRKTIVCGIGLGLVFCAASNLQQFAFNDSTSGKIAFITAVYMFFVPLFGLVLKKRVPVVTWLCVLLGFTGLYFLCIDANGIGTINKGDILAFACAAVFAVHILMVEKFAPDV